MVVCRVLLFVVSVVVVWCGLCIVCWRLFVVRRCYCVPRGARCSSLVVCCVLLVVLCFVSVTCVLYVGYF